MAAAAASSPAPVTTVPGSLAGVWEGSRLPDDGGAPVPLRWALAALPARPPAPTVFGGAGGDVTLRGSFDAASRTVRVVAAHIGAGAPTTTYTGLLHASVVVAGGGGGRVALAGKYVDDATGATGRFVVALEPGSDASGVPRAARRLHPLPDIATGLWIGVAAPDASLAPFLIPTNPIRWALTLVFDEDSGGAAFGGGAFDDSGDVEGHQVLHFALSGTDLRSPAAAFRLVKRYERAGEAADGVEVVYECKMEVAAEDGALWLSGTWANTRHGSHGTFLARRVQPAAWSSADVLCSLCAGAIRPGDSRGTCSECALPWSACATCVLAGTHHPHMLHPCVSMPEPVASGATCGALVVDALTRFAGRPLFGTRPSDATAFAYRTYGEVARDVAALVAAFAAAGVTRGARVALVTGTSDAACVAALAASVAGLVQVPLPPALDADALQAILTDTAPEVVAAEPQAAAACDAAASAAGVVPRLRLALPPSIDAPPPADVAPVAAAAAAWRPYAALVASPPRDVAAVLREAVAGAPAADPSALAAVLYTSGSTGRPKGAMFSEALALPTEGAPHLVPYVRLDFQRYDATLLLSLLSTLAAGGSRALGGGLAVLLEDAAAAEPTHMGATPVFWNSLYTAWQTKLGELSAAEATKPVRRSPAALAAAAATAVRSTLGRRLQVATSGGAPLAPAVQAFLRDTLRIDLVSLYGARECGGIARDGLVYAGLDVILLPLDGDDGGGGGGGGAAGTTRGEIAVASPRLITGYYKDDAATARAFVEVDGKRYYRTGDVGELVTAAGAGGGSASTRVRVVDRCGAGIKLARGEWLSPASMESVLEGCPDIAQALVMARTDALAPVAVIVPSARWAAAARDRGLDGDGAARDMLRVVRNWGTHHHLRNLPVAVALEAVPWSAADGCVTEGSLKKVRSVLHRRYADSRDRLYAAAAAAAGGDSVADAASTLSPAFRAMLPPGLVVDPTATFAECGGDSLAAVQLLRALAAAGAPLPLTALQDYPLSHLSSLLDVATAGGGAGLPPPTRQPVDWYAEMALPAAWVAEARGVAARRAEAGTPRGAGVFITGATGFLGPLLVVEALATTPPPARVIALVRAPSHSAARARLAADAAAAGVMPWLAAGGGDGGGDDAARLEVLAGDVAEPRLGLTDAEWAHVAASCGTIIAAAARVDMLAPYASLRTANVGGALTAALLAVAAGARLLFVSSVGALAGGVAAPGWRGDGWAPPDTAVLATKSGYGASKTVAEALLAAAAADPAIALDVTFVRPGAICASTAAAGSGYANRHDATVLMAAACVAARVSPHPATLPLRWVPVDWVARSTLALARDPAASRGAYNLAGTRPPLADVLAAAAEATGTELTALPPAAWRAAMQERLPPTHPATPLLPALLASNVGADLDAAAAGPSTDGAVAALGALGVPWFTPPSPPTLLRQMAWLAAAHPALFTP